MKRQYHNPEKAEIIKELKYLLKFYTFSTELNVEVIEARLIEKLIGELE